MDTSTTGAGGVVDRKGPANKTASPSPYSDPNYEPRADTGDFQWAFGEDSALRARLIEESKRVQRGAPFVYLVRTRVPDGQLILRAFEDLEAARKYAHELMVDTVEDIILEECFCEPPSDTGGGCCPSCRGKQFKMSEIAACPNKAVEAFLAVSYGHTLSIQMIPLLG